MGTGWAGVVTMVVENHSRFPVHFGDRTGSPQVGLETLGSHEHTLTSVYVPLNSSASVSLTRDRYLFKGFFFLR